ncbi:hypothetical protein [Rickettsiella endosymbiont of Dermanyssus gallinae]|uniref:hypothetical protein n=1 Tax=Rickettsiella endosymbiont of Dermanyssus gallinae TaxID=2856608 RepID=UPI001C52A5B6|nr:hypothetical protein [Rickettsiella endosymbiont of Dermanyssus gallinae]
MAEILREHSDSLEPMKRLHDSVADIMHRDSFLSRKNRCLQPLLNQKKPPLLG